LNIVERIRERGPMTVAAFMDLALYDPESGYYARAARRSGRAGDFFTSVDVGPVFGELLEIQIAEMAGLLGEPGRGFDLVEAGAGNGRLAADILAAMRSRDGALFESVRVHLVEASAAAREQHRAMLGDGSSRLVSSSEVLPEAFEGVLLANELLDAMPVHQVVQRDHELNEIYVEADGGRLRVAEGPLSTPRIVEYLNRLSISLEPGWRVEINLAAADWIGEVARRVRRGFVILIDYGHAAR
jgi:SAM-dependent MidA family methyltransferase